MRNDKQGDKQMFEIDHLDIIGNDKFDNLFDYLFGGCPRRRVVDDNGVESTRIYFPRRKPAEGNRNVSHNGQPPKSPSWRKEVRGNERVPRNTNVPEWTQTPSKPVAKSEPKSIIEMLEDGDKRLEDLLGRIVDKKLDERRDAARPVEDDSDYDDGSDEDEDSNLEKKDPFVFIANRMSFLVQTLQPIVLDTSNIEVTQNSLTIAVNEEKTFPKIDSLDELGFITSKINASPTVMQEIEDYLKDTRYTNIYCFPTTMENRDGDDAFAVKFVVYERK